MAAEPESTDFVPDVRAGRTVKSTKTIIASVVAVAVLCGFGGLIWYAYNEGVREGSESVAPLVIADKNPTRVRPESPGGMEVPFQDKQVYENLASGEGATQVERLLPPPETPLPRPKPVMPESATEAAAESASSGSATSDGADQAAADSTATSSDGNDGTGAAASSQTTVALAPPSPEAPPTPAAPTTEGTAGEAPPEAPGTPAASAPEPPAPAAQQAAEAETAQQAAEAETAPVAGVLTAAAEAPPEIAAAPPSADPLSGAFLVQLSALKSAEAAQSGWRQIRAANQALLGQLSPHIQRAVVGDKGVFFRLRAGPLADRAAARSLCDSLANRKVGCLVVRR